MFSAHVRAFIQHNLFSCNPLPFPNSYWHEKALFDVEQSTVSRGDHLCPRCKKVWKCEYSDCAEYFLTCYDCMQQLRQYYIESKSRGGYADV